MTPTDRRPLRVALAQFEGDTTLRVLPLAAGLLAATVARATDLEGVDVEVATRRGPPDEVAAALAHADVLGLSLYAWNERYALEVARRVRALSPSALIVAGGPSAPRAASAADALLRAHPALDLLVAGEGERVFLDILRAARTHPTASPALRRALAALPSVALLVDDGAGGRALHQSPRAPRLAGRDFDEVGSPYLDGTFDALLDRDPTLDAAVFETNRGCPFACTFCDWGQATESRVHELPLARVEAELRWAAERGLTYVYFVDANFGIRPRDVEITRTIGRLARELGAPRFVYFHLTKNATERNLATVESLLEAGVGTQVALSMQDFDPGVLAAIKRDNIHPERALALRERCHARGLPTTNELLLGLPGQSEASFRASIVSALTPFPRDAFYLYPTRALVNAELADPAYRARFGLETRLVPSLPSDPSREAWVLELEELVVGSQAMATSEWRRAFAFGYLLAAIANQRLFATTLHVLRWVLGADVAGWIDALLAAERPALATLRDELARHADAILEARAAILAVPGFGPRRLGAAEAVTARALLAWAELAAEVADVTAAHAPEHAALLREAVAWDALGAPAPGARPVTARFDWDWLAFADTMADRAAPAPGPLAVTALPPAWAAAAPPDYLAAFLALGWARAPRVTLARTGP